MSESGTLKSFADKFSKNSRLNDIFIEKKKKKITWWEIAKKEIFYHKRVEGGECSYEKR